MSRKTEKRTTVKAYEVTDVKNWMTRWPTDGTLGLNPATREPVVYNEATGPAESRSIRTTLSWKRRADVLVILTHPDQFSVQAVQAAQARYNKYRPPALDDATYQEAETRLIEAWRSFHAAPPESRGPLRAEIREAQAELNALEEANASITQPGRELVTTVMAGSGKLGTSVNSLYVQPMPIKKRGMDVGEIVA